MPSIWSEKEDRSTARYLKEDLGGTIVHFGIDPNPHTHYLDADGKPIQHDRAFVAEMPEVGHGRFDHIIKNGMRKAHLAAIQPPGYLSGKITSDPKTQGGTTGTLVLYDPHTFMLDIGSKGDSPAFLILDDGKQVCVAKVTYGGDIRGHKITNSLNRSPDDVNLPVRPAQYFAGGKIQNGTIHLDELIQQLATDEQLDLSTLKTHILVASDGILKPDQETQALDEVTVKKLYMHAQTANNKAEAIAHAAMYDEHGNKKSRDNISVVLIEDIQPHKGHPIAACVCDGFYKFGGDVADKAITAIQNVVQHEIDRINAIIEYQSNNHSSTSGPQAGRS